MTDCPCCVYFGLLMWKNFLIKVRHKKQFAVEIIIPLIFCCVLLVLRYYIVAKQIGLPTMYPAIPLDNLNSIRQLGTKSVNLWELDYTPVNPVTDEIIREAAKSLGIGFRGFNDSKSLEKFMLRNGSLAGVEFDPELATATKYPTILKYSIRLPGALRTAQRFSEFRTWLTKNLFPIRFNQGPRNKYDADGGLPPGYIREGFTAIQSAISSSYIKLAANRSVQLPKIMLQRFPHQAYTEDRLLLAMENLLSVVILLSFVYPCIQAIKYVTMEKQTQLKEAMKIMGLTTSLHWTAWFLTLWICFVLTAFFIVIVLKIPWFQGFTMAVLPKSSFTLMLFFLSVYSAATVTYVFMVSSFFTRASTASAVGGLVFFIFYTPYVVNMNRFAEMTLASKIHLSFLLNTALSFGLQIVMQWESSGEGAQWKNLFDTVTVDSNLSLGHVISMLLADCLIHLLIALYVEKVMPGVYGLPYKWYFCVTRRFWCPRRTYIEPSDFYLPESDAFEKETSNDYQVGIQVISLRKKFGSKVAVDDLSLNIYEGQVTVLLGHNGAGKTATISMITGLIRPTSGTAIINGMDIMKDMPKIRKSLGYCPQHNILFDELTVREHIIFFSRLKGYSKQEVKEEVERYIRLLGLEDKRDAQAGTLSGGLKRKLSVGVAMCGGSKVVLCDEPSAGMDPAARRELWDFILLEKKQRTILLTTHFMDEADVLGDRIAIMAAGRLICVGTPFFLKKRFGSGYTLICSKTELCKTEKVTALLKKHIPEVVLKRDVARELSYQLPDMYVDKFETMLKELEESLVELGLESFGLSMTTIEDVFMKTGSESSEDIDSSKDLSVKIEYNEAVLPVSGIKHTFYKWGAMVLKKYYCFQCHWYFFMLQLLVPLAFVALSVYVSKSIVTNQDLPSRQLMLDSYGPNKALLEIKPSSRDQADSRVFDYANMFSQKFRDQSLEKVDKPIPEFLLSLKRGNIHSTRYMVAATIADDEATGWFNNEALHTAPISLNLLYNAVAKSILGPNTSIEVTNHPLPYKADYKVKVLKTTSGLGFQLALNLTFALAFMSALFIVYPLNERETRAKLLQFISGAEIFMFWMSHFLWDFAVYAVISLCTGLAMYAFQEPGFATLNDLGRMILVFMLHGFASLPVTYLVSFMFDEAAAGLIRLGIFNVFTGDALYIICFVLNLPVVALEDTAEKLQQIFMIFPNFALAQALTNQANLVTLKTICEMAREHSGVPLEVICQNFHPACCRLEPFGFKNPGIGQILIYLTTVGCCSMILLFFVEYTQNSYFKTFKNRVSRPKLTDASRPMDEDEEVTKEKERIKAMSMREIKEHNLVMREVSKFYGKFLAVNRLSLTVDGGDCFGLLGTNGAGKTTTFKMLTGDEALSYGDIWVKGSNTKRRMRSVYKMIGYCPQFEGLLWELTCWQTLKIHCLLRGIPTRHMNTVIHNMAIDLAFEKHLFKKIGACSGGTKRKVSTAVAIIGHPQVIYLDEPTAGVDVSSRRRLWNMLSVVRDHGKGIMLTSHSMEECEAMCTRIAVMVNGTFKCLGSPQHLKNKFSKGLTLVVKVKHMEQGLDYVGIFKISSEKQGFFESAISRPSSLRQRPLFKKRSALHDIIRIEQGLGKHERDIYNFIIQKFPGAVLKDAHRNVLTFGIPDNIMPYSRVFGLMEENRNDLNIEDYSLTQTTLEQVFLEFAKKQI